MSTTQKSKPEFFREAQVHRESAARLAESVAPEPQNVGASDPRCITPPAISKAKKGDASNPFYRVLQWLEALKEAEGEEGERKAEHVLAWLRAEKARLWKDTDHDLATLHRCEQRSDGEEDNHQVGSLQDPEKAKEHMDALLQQIADSTLLVRGYRQQEIQEAV